jgi:hypothetical protein
MSSVNQSMIAKMAELEKSFTEQLALINSMREVLGEGELVLGESKGKGTKPRAKKSKPEGEKADRPPSAWNIFLKETVDDMKANGWPAWTGLDGTDYGASEKATVKDKSGAEHEAWVYSSGPFKGKEVTPAQGGMTRASFLKAEADPAAKEKALKWQAKLAEKKAASAGSSTAASGDEAEAAAEKKPRKPQSEETKAAAAVKRAATKAAKTTPAAVGGGGAAAAPAAAPPPVPKATVPKKMVIGGAAAPKKAVDLSFYAWEHNGVDYYTNDRSDVVSTEFDWVGRFNGKEIDETVEAPEDLGDARMRE